MTFQEHLAQIGACRHARRWSAFRTAREAWDDCTHPEWLLWWIYADGALPFNAIIRMACEIARSAMHLAEFPMALLAIDAAETWANDPTEENRVKAATAWRATGRDANMSSGGFEEIATGYLAYAAGEYFGARGARLSAVCGSLNIISLTMGAENVCKIIRCQATLPWTEPSKSATELETV